MENNNLKQKTFAVIILISIGLFSHFEIIAQTNFSGNWEFDKSQSNGDLVEMTYDGTVMMHISQKLSVLTVGETWKSKDNPDFNTADDLYNLDEKEHTLKSDFGTNTKIAKWSSDKKILTITITDVQELDGKMQEFVVVDTYSLSDDKKTLTVERYLKNPVTGETKAKKVYRRK